MVNVVSNVTFADSTVQKSQQSVRIKTISGASGTVQNITYRNIFLDGAGVAADYSDYGVVVTQSYNGVKGSPTNGVTVTGFVLQNVTGTVGSDAVRVYIECGLGSCNESFRLMHAALAPTVKFLDCCLHAVHVPISDNAYVLPPWSPCFDHVDKMSPFLNRSEPVDAHPCVCVIFCSSA